MKSTEPFRVIAWPPGRDDDLNPYVRLMLQAFRPPAATIVPYRPSLRAQRGDAFLIQWPEAIFHGRFARFRPIAAAKAWSVLRTAERAGLTALVIHNLVPHAALDGWRRRLWQDYLRNLLTRTNLLISLSPGTLAAFRTHYSDAANTPAVILPHPHYRDAYPHADRSESRRMLGLPETGHVVGIIGSLRPSKHTPEAIAAFRAAGTEATLLVTGDCGDAHWAEILKAAEDDPRVHLKRGRLSDRDLASGFAAVDTVLLNQTDGLNSGTALLALSMDRRVLAPATPAFVELADEFGKTWVQTFLPPLLPAHISQTVRDGARPEVERAPLESRDPMVLSRELLRALRAHMAAIEADAESLGQVRRSARSRITERMKVKLPIR